MSEVPETDTDQPIETTDLSTEPPTGDENPATGKADSEVPEDESKKDQGRTSPSGVDDTIGEQTGISNDVPPKKRDKPKKGKGKKEKKAKVDKTKIVDSERTSTLGSQVDIDVEAEVKKMFQKPRTRLSEMSFTNKLPALQSLSVHSEDSTSSKEEPSKKESEEFLDTDFNFQEKYEFCISALQANRDVPDELQMSVQTLFNNFQQAMAGFKKRKEKAEAELKVKTEKMNKGLTRANDLQCEVDALKKKVACSEVDILNLKKELDESHAHEHDMIDEINLLRQKLTHLDSDLEKKKVEEQLREQGLEVTAKSRESFTKEIARLKQDLELSHSRLQLTLQDIEEYHRKYKEKETECNEMEEMLKSNKYDVMREVQKSKLLEADLEKLNEEMKNLKLAIAKHYKTFKNASRELVKKDEEVFELKKINRQVNQQNEIMVKLTSELKERLELSTSNYLKLEEEHTKLKAVCSNQTGDLNFIRKKSGDAEKSQDKWVNKFICLDKKRLKAVQTAKNLFDQMKDMSHEAKETKLSTIKLKRTIGQLKKDNNLLSKQIRSLQVVIEQQKKQGEETNQIINQITEESNKLKSENSLQEKTINKYMRMQEKDMRDKMALEQTNNKMKDDLSNCSIEYGRLQKELHEKNSEVKYMENLYQSLSLEKKVVHKKLLEGQAVIKDLQNKTKYIDEEMELVKDQLAKKQHDYEILQTSNKKDVFTKDTMIIKLDTCLENKRNLLKAIENKDMVISTQMDVIIKKESYMKELNIELETQRRQAGDLKTVIQKRNAELSLVYEKVELMKYILKNGEEQYQQRLKDIELLKKEIRKLRSDKKLLIGLAENTPNLRQEMFHLHKDLSKERQKCRALEEQMENPLNIHRWRILEGRDPDKKDLLEKNRILQKKLIRVEQDNGAMREQCSSMEMLYLNMRTYLNNLPGKESTQYLDEARRNLKDKTRENKMLSALLAAYENELAQLKKKMEEANKESIEIKQKFYDLKKKFDQDKISKRKFSESDFHNVDTVKPFPAGFAINYTLQQASKIKH